MERFRDRRVPNSIRNNGYGFEEADTDEQAPVSEEIKIKHDLVMGYVHFTDKFQHRDLVAGALNNWTQSMSATKNQLNDLQKEKLATVTDSQGNIPWRNFVDPRLDGRIENLWNMNQKNAESFVKFQYLSDITPRDMNTNLNMRIALNKMVLPKAEADVDIDLVDLESTTLDR